MHKGSFGEVRVLEVLSCDALDSTYLQHTMTAEKFITKFIKIKYYIFDMRPINKIGSIIVFARFLIAFIVLYILNKVYIVLQKLLINYFTIYKQVIILNEIIIYTSELYICITMIISGICLKHKGTKSTTMFVKNDQIAPMKIIKNNAINPRCKGTILV